MNSAIPREGPMQTSWPALRNPCYANQSQYQLWGYRFSSPHLSRSRREVTTASTCPSSLTSCLRQVRSATDRSPPPRETASLQASRTARLAPKIRLLYPEHPSLMRCRTSGCASGRLPCCWLTGKVAHPSGGNQRIPLIVRPLLTCVCQSGAIASKKPSDRVGELLVAADIFPHDLERRAGISRPR